MKTNDPIEIRRVANGFLVQPAYTFVRGGEMCDEQAERFVFADLYGLHAWLESHFPKAIDALVRP